MDVDGALLFLPAEDFNGIAPPLLVHGLDNTYSGGFSNPLSNVYADVSVTGGSTAVSALPVTLSNTVTPVNDDPIAPDVTFTVIESGSFFVSPIASVTDADGDTPLFSLVGSAANGLATLNTHGIFSYVHSGGNLSSCLLYTSPSPRDATLSRMPSSA